MFGAYEPAGQAVQVLGVSQLSEYSEWPLCEHEDGGMYLPTSHVVQPLLHQLGVHRWVHEQESALQQATDARRTKNLLGVSMTKRVS